MTPFDLALRHEMDAEVLRMANEWFFKWHAINMPGKVVEVDSFEGRNFHVGGLAFAGSIRDRYWQAIGRYLANKAHATFDKWNEATKIYTPELRRSSLDETANCLLRFVGRIAADAIDTDRRLRGKGYPESVQPYDASNIRATAKAEVERLRAAHQSVLPEPKPESVFKRLETFLTTWRGMLALAALIVGAVLAIVF